MLDSFTVTFSQVFVLFVFIAIGFVMKKTGKISNDFNKGISNLLVYIFLPFMTFGNMADNFEISVLSDKINLISVSLCMLCAFVIIAFIFSRVLSKSPQTRDVYMYSFTFPNSGYFGNPVVLAIFGELMLFDFMIFSIPFLILTYTFGVYILNPNRTFSLKGLFTPTMISLMLGMAVGALNINLPSVARSIIDAGSKCMAPSAMILTGIVFASKNLKNVVSNIRVYIACIIKMIILPLIVTFILARINIPDNISVIIIIMLTLPTGLNSIVFPEAYGGDSLTGAQMCFVSTLICLIFMPLLLALYQVI